MAHALLLTAMVVIRTYNYAQVPPRELAGARATTDRTFQQAGISLQCIDCRVPGDAGVLPTCTEPLREGQDFILRLRESPTGTSIRAIALGTSLFDRESGGGVLMTVNPRQVAAIAQGAGTDPSTLLGRAIAHELGHLLLGCPNHPRGGLMRALWSQDELRGLRPADWQFSPQEAAHMRQGLAARARAAN